MAAAITAIAAIASVGFGIYSATRKTPKGADVGPAPSPTNYYQYDANGNLTSSQVWDEGKKAYVYKEDPEPQPPSPDQYFGSSNYGAGEEPPRPIFSSSQNPARAQWENKKNEGKAKYESFASNWKNTSEEWKRWADRKVAREKEQNLRTDIRTKMLENLNQTPEDRVAAYEQYAKTFSESMEKGVTEQYNLAKQAQEESMTASGLRGSRAYADTMGQMEKEKLKADVDIAAKAELAKNELANVDRNYWLNTLNAFDAGARADAVAATAKAQAANQAALGGTAASLGEYMANSQNQWNKWNADYARRMGMINSINNAAGGLMYLYGYGGRGGGGGYTPSMYSYGNVSSLNTTLPAGGLSLYNY